MKKEVKDAIQAEKKNVGVTGTQPDTTTPGDGAKTISLKDIQIDMKLGRPTDPTSERQKRLAEMETKRTTEGTLHRGRPKDPTSANAIKQAAREARITALKLEEAKRQGLVVIDVTPEQLKEAEKAVGHDIPADVLAETNNAEIEA